MKAKKLRKKLSLNKKTIAHLNDSEMKAIYGGITAGTCPTRTCPTTSFKFCCV